MLDLAARFNAFPFLRYFSLALSLQPCYNPIEIHSSRRAVSYREKQSEHFLRSPSNGHSRRPRQSCRTSPCTDRKTVWQRVHCPPGVKGSPRSEEHTSELQS